MVKRCCDIVVSAAVLVVLAPLLLLLGIGVALDSGLPVFFSQLRVGRNFAQFRLWKFRTMRTCLPGSSITVLGDPRITRLGKLLRATKLDELPQFWNVFLGDMSLVGPRPEIPEFVWLFKLRYARLLTVRPGITDIASIRFRNEEELLAASADPLRDYVERVLPIKLDLADEYLQTASFFKDLSILFRTATIMIRK